MSAEAFILRAASLGVELYVDGNILRCCGNGGKPDSELIAGLREHKAEILSLLSASRPVRTDGGTAEPGYRAAPARVSDLYETEADYARALLRYAVQDGLTLSVNNGRLVVTIGRKSDTDLLGELRSHEAVIINVLIAEPQGSAEPARVDRHAATPATIATLRTAFAAFQETRPHSSTRFRHDQACWSAEMFLNEWESLAVEFGWTVDDIFSPPRGGKSGLAYWLGTELVTALGPESATTESDRVFDRMTRQTWINPYAAELKQ